MKPMEIKQYVSIVSEWFATVMPQTQSSLVHRQLRASASLQKSVKVEQSKAAGHGQLAIGKIIFYCNWV